MIGLNRFKITILLIIVLVVVSVPLFSGGSQENTKKSTESESPTVVTILTTYAPIEESSLSMGNAFNKAIDAFEQENPNIDIKHEIVPGSRLEDTLMARISANQTPDIFLLEQNWGLRYYESDLLGRVPTPYVEILENDFFEKPIRTVRYPDGNYYGMPISTDTVGIFGNRDMFDEVGLLSVPDTFDQLEEFAKKLTKKDSNGNLVQSGYTPWVVSQHMSWPFYWSAGGIWSGFEGTVDDLLSDAAVRAYDYAFTKPFQEWETASVDFFSDGVEGFRGNKVAMTFTGPWELETLRGLGINYFVGPPLKDKERYSVQGGWNLHVSSNSVEKDEAWQLISYLTSDPESDIMYVEEGLRLPRLKATPEKVDYNELPPGLEEFIDYISMARRKPLEGFHVLLKGIPAAVQKIANGGIGTKEALQQIVDEYKFEMEE